jgi:hypothetical protein
VNDAFLPTFNVNKFAINYRTSSALNRRSGKYNSFQFLLTITETLTSEALLGQADLHLSKNKVVFLENVRGSAPFVKIAVMAYFIKDFFEGGSP